MTGALYLGLTLIASIWVYRDLSDLGSVAENRVRGLIRRAASIGSKQSAPHSYCDSRRSLLWYRCASLDRGCDGIGAPGLATTRVGGLRPAGRNNRPAMDRHAERKSRMGAMGISHRVRNCGIWLLPRCSYAGALSRLSFTRHDCLSERCNPSGLVVVPRTHRASAMRWWAASTLLFNAWIYATIVYGEIPTKVRRWQARICATGS